MVSRPDSLSHLRFRLRVVEAVAAADAVVGVLPLRLPRVERLLPVRVVPAVRTRNPGNQSFVINQLPYVICEKEKKSPSTNDIWQLINDE